MTSLVLSFVAGIWILNWVGRYPAMNPFHRSLCFLGGTLYLLNGLFRILNKLFLREYALENGFFVQLCFAKEMLSGACIILSIFAVIIIENAELTNKINKAISITAGTLLFVYIVIILLLNPQIFDHSANQEIFILAYKSRATILGACVTMIIAAFICSKGRK